MADAGELAARYMRLVDGFVTTQLLYVAASSTSAAVRRRSDERIGPRRFGGFTVQRVVRTGSTAGLGE